MYVDSHLIKCQGCGLLYVSPRLTMESLARHFNNTYLRPAEALEWERSRHRVYRSVLDLVRMAAGRELFEIGCSYGTFLSMCRDAGLTVGGCDVSAEACRQASERLGVEILNGDLEDLGDRVPPQDCMVSIDTLYYCSDPQRHLAAIHNKLKPGGRLVLRVRNAMYVELTARLGLDSCPIEHLYFFTPYMLGRMLGKAGFTRYDTVPGVCHGIPRPLDSLLRAVAKGVMSGLGDRYVLTRDFCTVAIKD